MSKDYRLKIKNNTNTSADQLEHTMDQDLNFWRVKNTWTATRQTHNLLHNCIFNTIHHLSSSWAWAIDAEITTTKKAISGTELKDKLIHQMAVWPLRGTPRGRRNGPTGISGNSAPENAKSCSRGRIIPCTSTWKIKIFYIRGDPAWRALSRQIVKSFHPWSI